MIPSPSQLEDDLEQTKSSIKSKASKSETLSEEIKSLENKLAKLGVRQEEIKQIQDGIAAMQAQKEVMLAEKARANAKMQSDYSDTDAELRSIYANFQAGHAGLLRSIEEKSVALRAVESECVKNERDMSKLAESLGRLAAQEADYRRKKQELSELANRLGGAAAGPEPGALLSSLQAALHAKQGELEGHKAESRAMDLKFEAEIGELKKQESTIVEGTRIKSEQMTAAKQKRSEKRFRLAVC